MSDWDAVSASLPIPVRSQQYPVVAASPASAFLPINSLQYFSYVTKAYNTAIFLNRELEVRWIVFGTAMSFIHRFLERESAAFNTQTRDNNPPALTLAAAAMFLACKAEGIGAVRLSKIIQLAFEIDEAKDKETYKVRKEQVLQMELWLLHTLNYDVLIPLPYDRVDELVDLSGNSRLQQLVKKMLSYTFGVPLLLKLSAKNIAEACVLFAADACGCVAETRIDAERRKVGPITVSDEDVQGFKEVMIEYLARTRKKIDVESIDQLVAQHRRDLSITSAEKAKRHR